MEFESPFSAPATPESTARFERLQDVSFLEPHRSEKLDAYLPSSQFVRPVPAVVWIHGGGWRTGDKDRARERNVCGYLAEIGYAAFSINYTLGSDEFVPWPQNFHDCKSAVRYLRKEAARWGIDPERIAVAGGSAGGHLALLVGASSHVPEMNEGGLYLEQSNSVSCVIDLYGVSDVSDEKRSRHFEGTTPEKTAENVRAASPKHYLGKNTPPVLLAHGDNDAIVSVEHSRTLAKALTAAGVPYQYIEVPGAPHTFHFQPEEMDLRPAVKAFLEKYLGIPGRNT